MHAVSCLISPKHFEDVKFQETVLKGHYGNPITLFKTQIKDTEIIGNVIERLTSLAQSDKEKIEKESNVFINKNSLYLRFDKQTAFLGTLKIKRDDPIYVRIRFKASGKRSETTDIIGISKEIGLIT